MAMVLAAADLGVGSGHSAVGDQELARRVLGLPEDRVVRLSAGARLPRRPSAAAHRAPRPQGLRRRGAQGAMVKATIETLTIALSGAEVYADLVLPPDARGHGGVRPRQRQRPAQPAQPGRGRAPQRGRPRHAAARSAHRGEEARDARTAQLRFDIGLLAARLVGRRRLARRPAAHARAAASGCSARAPAAAAALGRRRRAARRASAPWSRAAGGPTSPGARAAAGPGADAAHRRRRRRAGDRAEPEAPPPDALRAASSRSCRARRHLFEEPGTLEQRGRAGRRLVPRPPGPARSAMIT